MIDGLLIFWYNNKTRLGGCKELLCLHVVQMEEKKIMSGYYLKPIYFMTYEEEFTYESFEKRMEMQKAVYLLQEMGVSVGDYDFMWYKHGPYSQNLQEDMYQANSQERAEVQFSTDTLKCINKLHDLLNEEVAYSISQWAECLASLHYLKENVFSEGTDPDEIVKMLTEKKQHLDNKQLNLKALSEVEELFV